MGSFYRGLLLIPALALCSQVFAAPKLEVNSDKLGMSTYIMGEIPSYALKVEGLEPNASGLSLDLDVVDEFEKTVSKSALNVSADASGKWAGSFKAPASKFGFYKIKAKLSDGTTLASAGSRPAGFVTYCVVPDPAKREALDQQDAFFFTVGVDYIDTTNYLGGHWTHTGCGYYEWKNNEPKHAGEFAEARAKAKAEGKPFKQSIYNFTTGSGDSKKPWRTYQFLWLFCPPDWAVEKDSKAYTTGILTKEGEAAWVDYARVAATAYAEDHPDESQHLYQITWEPHYPWGFKGTDEQLVHIYELVYKVIHDADPKAVVVGPAGSHFLNEWHEALLKKGLGKYIDGFSIHPFQS